MTVQTPLAPPPTPEPDIDAGVIEDARARQRRHRRIGSVAMLATVIAAALVAGGFGGGGRGLKAGRLPSASGSGAGPAHGGASTSFPGAPITQKNGYGVSSDVCPLAPPNRYLPPRSGCVTVRRADVNGDGRPDLVIVYSRLSRKHPFWYAPGSAPSGMKHEYGADAAFLEVVFAGGTRLTTPIKGVRAAAVDAIADVSADPGDEIFLEVNRISSGATGVAYGFRAGRLVPAGVYLSYGGDSGVQAGFNCLGNPPRLIQRYFTFVGPNELTRSWRETEVVYAWNGPKLERLSRRTFGRLVALKFKPAGSLKSGETQIGSGCLHGVS